MLAVGFRSAGGEDRCDSQLYLPFSTVCAAGLRSSSLFAAER
jgi:hypothetical protein